jgi:mono/diheme cytochrome c family protein
VHPFSFPARRQWNDFGGQVGMPKSKYGMLVQCLCAVLLCCIAISCTENQKPSTESTQAPPSVTPPSTPDSTIARSGEDIFKARCIFCHGIAGDQINMGAANLKLSLIDSASIVQAIKNGKGKMPRFGDIFSDSQMVNLVQYVKSLRTISR